MIILRLAESSKNNKPALSDPTVTLFNGYFLESVEENWTLNFEKIKSSIWFKSLICAIEI